MLIVQDIEVAEHLLIADLGAAESHGLVENRQGVAHGSVRLEGNDVEGLVIDGNPLLSGDVPQVADDVRDADPVEIIGLAAGEDGREDLVLLGRRQDEDGVCRRFLEGLEEGVEGLGAEHMDLVHDIDAVAADLRRDVDLVDEHLDVIDAVVGGRVEFVDAVGTAFPEGDAGFAFAARLHIGGRMRAVDGLGEDTRRAGLADAARAAEQVRVRQLAPDDGVLQGLDDVVLADEGLEGVRPVFACGYDVLRHKRSSVNPSLQMYAYFCLTLPL